MQLMWADRQTKEKKEKTGKAKKWLIFCQLYLTAAVIRNTKTKKNKGFLLLCEVEVKIKDAT